MAALSMRGGAASKMFLDITRNSLITDLSGLMQPPEVLPSLSAHARAKIRKQLINQKQSRILE